MWLIGLLVVVAIAYLLFRPNPNSSSQQSRSTPSKSSAPGLKQGAVAFDSPIPSGYQIFAKNLPVAGMQHHKAEAIRFAQGSNQDLALEPEPSNPHDKNAIKLIGITASNRYFIGYLPKELAEQITATGLLSSLKVRLVRIYVGKDDYIEIHYQILGPKAEKKRFDDFLNNQPADSEQKDYLKFFGLAIPKGLTAGQAEEIISQHKKSSSEAEQGEWFGYSNVLEEFEDSDFRETYEIKKVPKAVLIEAMNQLKQQGKSYSYLGDNIHEVADYLIRTKPELERKKP